MYTLSLRNICTKMHTYSKKYRGINILQIYYKILTSMYNAKYNNNKRHA